MPLAAESRAKPAGRSGELLNGAYELHELLESDADHETYRATDKKRAQVVQVKLLRPEVALKAGVVQKFLHAPKSLAGLKHPNLSQVLAIESDATGIPFVVQEHVQGESLGRTVESFPQGMPLGVAINLLCPVVEAVAAAHERGVVHGRLQLEHVLLAGAGGGSVPKVTHFGRPPVEADLRSDVWALGALLYRTLSGHAIDRPGAKHAPLEEHAPHLPGELLALVERCLHRDPQKRPADAAAVRDALGATRERLRGAEKKPKPAAEPKREAPATPAATKPDPKRPPKAIALDKTVAANRAKPAEPAPSFDDVDALPSAAAADALAATIAAEDDGPELSVEPAPSEAPAAAPDPQIATLSDLAAAFGPIEGDDRIGQGESEQATAGRSFRKAFDEAQAGATVERRKGAQARRAAREEREQAQAGAEAAPVPASRKQLREGREGAAVSPRALSDEQLRKLRETAKDEESRRDRIIGALIFWLFVIALAFFTPILCDPKHEQARAVFGARANLAVAGFSVLSVIALIRVWTVQIHSSPMLLRPVTTTLKVVTALVCVLSATFFLPAGALGPIERFARLVLPWGSGFFYLFLGFYGLLRSAREAASNAFMGVLLGLLYCSTFFGSYRVLATTIFANHGGAPLPGGAAAASTRARLTDMLLHGDEPAPQPGEALAADAGAATGEPMQERKEVGASEASDMNAIDQLERGRKQKSSQFEKLGDQVKEIAQ